MIRFPLKKRKRNPTEPVHHGIVDRTHEIRQNRTIDDRCQNLYKKSQKIGHKIKVTCQHINKSH